MIARYYTLVNFAKWCNNSLWRTSQRQLFKMNHANVLELLHLITIYWFSIQTWSCSENVILEHFSLFLFQLLTKPVWKNKITICRSEQKVKISNLKTEKKKMYENGRKEGWTNLKFNWDKNDLNQTMFIKLSTVIKRD